MALTEAKINSSKSGCTLFDKFVGDDLLQIQTDVTTSNSEVDTLQSEMTAVEADVVTLNSYTDQAVKTTSTPSFVGSKATGAALGGFVREVTVGDYSAVDADQTYTAANILGGLIRRDTMTSDRTDTLPTAADFVAALTAPQVGEMYEFTVHNEDAAQTITLASGAGGTDVASATMRIVAVSSSKRFGIVLDNVTTSTEAYSLYLLA